RVRHHIVAEYPVVLYDVVDQTAQKKNIASRPQGYPDIRHCRRTGETRVDVNNFGAVALACFNHPLESNGMVLCHVGTHNEDGIRIREVLLSCCGAAASKRSAQTGHCGAVSYSGLIADAVHSQSAGKELADHVIFFHVQRRAAEVCNGQRMHHRLTILLFDKSALARFPHAIGNHIHCRVERNFFPFAGIGPAIFDFGEATGMRMELEGVRALGAESSAGDRRLGIAFNGYELVVLMKDELSAAYAAIRANGPRDLSTLRFDPWLERARAG